MVELQEPQNFQKLDRLRKDVGKIMRLMEAAKLGRDAIGKVFVMYKDESLGSVMTREELWKLDPEQIGGWTNISELDVFRG